MSKVTMISFIHKNLVLRKSSTEGVGYFAKQKIKKDEILVVQGGKILPNNATAPTVPPKKLVDMCFQISDEVSICPLNEKTADGIFHINHSCEPNAGMKNEITLIAIRDIAKGEEILLDYAFVDADIGKTIINETIVCNCGSKTCRKVQDGKSWKNKNLQKKYFAYFSPYIKKLIRSKRKSN